jgi:DNA-binding protein HU-beta
MGKPMTQSKIIATLAENLEGRFGNKEDSSVPKSHVRAFLEELADLAAKECKGPAHKFPIPGIGRAVLAHRKARAGRNPATGETIQIKAKTVVRLRPSKAFKDAVLGASAKSKSKSAAA